MRTRRTPTLPPGGSPVSALLVFLSPAADGRPGGGFHKLDLQTGVLTRLFAKDTEDSVRSFVGVLSPDDRTFYVAARASAAGAPWTRIVAVDVATGAERLITMLSGDGLASPPGLALTADGTTLAVRTETGRLLIVHVDGSETRELQGPVPGFQNPYGRASLGSPAVMNWTSELGILPELKLSTDLDLALMETERKDAA